MKIITDLDNVLAGSMPALISFHNDFYGTSLTLQDFTSIRYWEVWGGTRKQAIKKDYQFHGSRYFPSVLPVKGAVNGVHELDKEHDLAIVTTRPFEVIQETLAWIWGCFGYVFKDILFANEYSLTGGTALDKAQLCKELGADVVIEDVVPHALACHELGIRVLLLNYPWNEDAALPEEIERDRVYSWQGIVDKLKTF